MGYSHPASKEEENQANILSGRHFNSESDSQYHFEGQGHNNSHTLEFRFRNKSEKVCDGSNHQNIIFRDHDWFCNNGTIAV